VACAELADLLLDRSRLLALARRHAPEYRRARPFPHVVCDDFLAPSLLERVLDEFPAPGGIRWQRFRDPLQRKLASRREELFGPVTRLLLGQLHSGVFVDFLETLTGIEGLLPDPHLLGGGLHQIERGGLLKVHVDFNRHPRLRLQRRLNVLLFLNRDWQESFGGHLELWDAEVQRCERRILPVFNRLVVFGTTATSYHGHPDPLRCPEDRTRKSLALYYYASEEATRHSRTSSARTTSFRARPGERIRPTLHGAVQRWLPPAMLEAALRLSRQR
jgi:hypothetical protein